MYPKLPLQSILLNSCNLRRLKREKDQSEGKMKPQWTSTTLTLSTYKYAKPTRSRESDLWRNTILRWREKKRRKQPNHESKRDWPVQKHNERKKTKKKLSKTKPEECDIKEKKLLCYIQATVNGDFSWVHIKLFATCLTVCKRSKYLSIPKPIPYLSIHFLCAIKIVWK